MSSIVNFKSPSGDDMIVLTKAEYEKLTNSTMSNEDIMDVAAVLEFKEKLDRGEEELIPADVVKRLIMGDDHPIRIWRKHRGIKAKDLAETVNVTPAFLSQIEHYKKDGSLKLYIKLAKVLNVTLDDLVHDDN